LVPLRHASAFDRTVLEAVLDAAVDGIVMIDAAGRIQSFNAAAERIFGYDREEVLGANVAMLAAEPHRSVHDGYIKSYLATGQGRIIGVGRRRLIARRKDGSEFPMELGVSDARLDEKQLFVGLIRDLSEEVAKETALANALAQLQAVADVLVDAFITIDAKGTVASFNRAAEQMFGYAADEVIGRNVAMLTPERIAREHDGYIARYETTGRKRIIGATRPESARRKDGTEFPIELAVTEMRISAERMFVGVVRDVSTRVENEALRDELIGDLQASNAELDEFAYITSHDLKEPLRGLANNARFLIEDHGGAVPEDARKRLARIQMLCERMEKLIDSLLYFSRLGRQELAIVDADLGEVVREVVELLGPYLEDERAEVRLISKLPVMRCDRQRVAEVFRNLIVNAVKHNRSERKLIEIGARQGEGGARSIFVKDNGVGIAPEFHDEVFKIFRQLNASDRDGEGTGSGLTFVQKIVERHAGRIWIDSRPGEGATFHFTLEKSTS
jgi:PAS domain S-box-containing protein